jgi:hypothetical protein
VSIDANVGIDGPRAEVSQPGNPDFTIRSRRVDHAAADAANLRPPIPLRQRVDVDQPPIGVVGEMLAMRQRIDQDRGV